MLLLHQDWRQTMWKRKFSKCVKIWSWALVNDSQNRADFVKFVSDQAQEPQKHANLTPRVGVKAAEI